eukprot:5844279-Karenia_brevis.AAC.1
MDKAVADMKFVGFVDWRLEVHRFAGYVLRELMITQRTSVQAHTCWCRFSGIRSSDKAIHEHKGLAKIADLIV